MGPSTVCVILAQLLPLSVFTRGHKFPTTSGTIRRAARLPPSGEWGSVNDAGGGMAAGGASLSESAPPPFHAAH